MRWFSWFTLIACMLAGLLAAQTGSKPRPSIPTLLNDTRTNQEFMRLSDLFPPDVNPTLRLAAEKILLGRSPEPGSFRILTLAELQDSIGDKAVVNIPPQVIVRRAGWPVSPDSIRSAAQGLRPSIDWARAEVVFPPEVATSIPSAPLRASELRTGRNPRTLMLRVECSNRHDCAPFWAEMKFPEAVERPIQTKLEPAQVELQGATALVRPGRPAFLLFAENGLRISMRVLPLKRGTLGETVKVLDPATHRTFLEQVRGTDLLQSELREAK